MKIPQALKTFFVPGQRLSQRIAFAGAWMLVSRLADRGLGIVRIIVLARLLSPEAFGLVSIGLIVIDLLNTFTNFGFYEALVQRKGEIRDYLDTVWTMSVIRGLVLGGILFGIAPLVASYFNSPGAESLIKAMAAVLVIQGFFNSGLTYFRKEMAIQKQFIWSMSSTLTDLVVSVTAAYYLRNAWALVMGSVASYIVLVVVSFIMHPYRPKLRFEIQQAKEMLNFGGWALLFTAANYIFGNIDTIFVGRLLGVVAMGLITMAHRISSMMGVEIWILNSAVIFPSYSKLQDNQGSLRLAFLTSIEAIAFLTFPIAAGLYVLAPDFATVLLGQQWLEAVPPMQILGIAGAIFSIITTSGSLFYAINKPRTRFLIIMFANIITISLLYPLCREYGLFGAALAVLAGNVSGLLLQTWALARIMKSGIKDLLRPLVFPLIVSVIIGVSLKLTGQAFNQAGPGELAVALGIAVSVYAACSLLLWKLFKSGPVQILNLLRGRK